MPERAAMLATLTNKGLVTLPKKIRDRLGLDAGSTLDLQLGAGNTITVRAVMPDALRLRGLLKSLHAAPVCVADKDAGIAAHLRGRHAKARR